MIPQTMIATTGMPETRVMMSHTYAEYCVVPSLYDSVIIDRISLAFLRSVWSFDRE